MVRTSLSMDILSIFSIILLMVTLVNSQNFDVMNYGAHGDGQSDDSQAFYKAWDAVCGATSENPTLIIPVGKTFLISPIKFQGPCKSYVAVQILGNIVAPAISSGCWKQQSREWITFSGVKGLRVTGNGKIDAKGTDWWKSCSNTDSCTRPTTITFQKCSWFYVSGLYSINSGRNHISISGSDHGNFSYLRLIAPKDSPNTDGIDISSSYNIEIFKSKIKTGDDCIAVNSGSFYINIANVICGPGHGISVGSLGKNGEKAEVEEIHVRHCRFYGTQNGARIKTWPGGSGYARKISFEQIKVFNSSNPIIIDQYYCLHDCNNKRSSAVQISDVTFRGIWGDSNTPDVINLSCSDKVACTNILVEKINLKSSVASRKASSSCINAYGRSSQSTPPVKCLIG